MPLSILQGNNEMANTFHMDCVSEVIDYNAEGLATCSGNEYCSYDGSIYWKFNQNIKSDRDWRQIGYAVASYNAEMTNLGLSTTSTLSPDDFLFLENGLKTATVPKADVICIEEYWDVAWGPRPLRVARGRTGMIEDILDFGVVADIKEVIFVPFNSTCPAMTEVGVVVRPLETSNELDLAVWNIKKTTEKPIRRFPITIPARQVGRSYFKMCERVGTNVQKTTANWDAVGNAVYVFAEAASCGPQDCSLSDFTSKMTNTLGSRVYFTVITFTTVGFGDIAPLSRRAQLIVSLTAMILVICANYI
jgi:hypothetical protein